STLRNGTVGLDVADTRIITFRPKAISEAEGLADTVTVTVTAKDVYGFTHTADFPVRTFVYDNSLWNPPAPLPPGYVEPSVADCYGRMTPVTFSPVYKFITGAYLNNATYTAIKPYVVPEGDQVAGGVNGNDRLYGFSIPLVGDLNGDGYPEIVAEGTHDGVSGYGADQRSDVEYIYIYDGRTGKRVLKYTLPMRWNNRSNTLTGGYHGSPSHFALVDANRNGLGEIIVAYGVNYTGSYGNPAVTSDASYSQQLASYEVVLDAGRNITGLKEIWKSTTSYADANGSTLLNYYKPIPQVADMDGDGTAEVVVYNHIYDATTGALKATLGILGTDAFAGMDGGTGWRANADRWINFSYVHDMDGDGKYDLVAGGKIYYEIDLGTGNYRTLDFSGRVADGRTGVVDINDDGLPDVVSVSRQSASLLRVSVWNPGFSVKDASGRVVRNAVPAPYLMEQVDLPLTEGSTGNNSYVYIGDIDGKYQFDAGGRKHYAPEIAILSGVLNRSNIAVHPNVAGIASDGIPTTGSTSGNGVIVAVSWDFSADTTGMTEGAALPAAVADKRLKVSFVMEHNDSSVDTGFTMFDFDNDGMQEICYRDETKLRIIKALVPYVAANYVSSGSPTAAYNRPDIILFSQPVGSFTGFEYPVIADIDNDASADMIVMGYNDVGGANDYGFIYAVGSSKEKFAPALPLWNQFMYDPFKVQADLQVPRPASGSTYPAVDRLQYTYLRLIHEGEADEELISGYQPFNGTLLQATKFSDVLTTAYGRMYEPVVYYNKGYLVGPEGGDGAKPEISGTVSGNDTLSFTVGNMEGALADLPVNTPVAIYKNGLASEANYVGTLTLGQCFLAGTDRYLTSAVKANSPGTTDGEVRLSLPMLDKNQGGTFALGSVSLNGIYLLRLGDNSNASTGTWVWRYGINDDTQPSEPDKGVGVASSQFRDCDWSDNAVIAAKAQLLPDLATVQAYQSVTLDLLANDILPDSYYPWTLLDDTAKHTLNSLVIYRPPTAGRLTLLGKGDKLKVNYRSLQPQSLVNSIDSFQYRVIFEDPDDGTTKVDIQTAYIYVLQFADGAATCSPEYELRLKAQPAGVVFRWFMADSSTYLQTDSLRHISFGFASGDSVYMVEPKVTASFADDSLQGQYFPQGRLSIRKIDGGTGEALRWTGQVNNDWGNPGNWVLVSKDGEMPVDYAPTSCSNVTIPSNVDNYPELTDSAYCRDIDLQDRAMLKSPQRLNYRAARVKFKLKPSEKGRYLMWSAPLLDMYSGDYHFTDPVSGAPRWSDFRLSLFQHLDKGGLAATNTFTASLGSVSLPLSPFVPFNLMFTPTSENRDSSLCFPKSNTTYEDGTGTVSGPLSRDKAGRFVTDGQTLDTSGQFDMPLADNAGMSLVQVVNPYLAYLNFSDFYAANADSIREGYYIWNGNVNDGFVAVLGGTNGRYLLSDPDSKMSSGGLIPPLQSFLVAKTAGLGTERLCKLKMSPAFTTTKPSASYTLRAANLLTGGLLQITLKEGAASASAALAYDLEASAGADSRDLPLVNYDALPLALYTLDTNQKPLLMNSSNDFASTTVPLGLNAKSPGEATLSFTGLDSFGFDVYLSDKKKGTETALTPSNGNYAFTLAKAGETNDRFSLRFVYTGKGVTTGAEELEVSSPFRAVSYQGGIVVDGLHPGTNLYIYNVRGQLLYQTEVTDTRISLSDSRLKDALILVNDGRSTKILANSI
ncbi:MAG: hypothetical protein LBL81_02670, partial [Tannerella sp.]|nr:hypothetical protein [Tannerella sp.]